VGNRCGFDPGRRLRLVTAPCYCPEHVFLKGTRGFISFHTSAPHFPLLSLFCFFSPPKRTPLLPLVFHPSDSLSLFFFFSSNLGLCGVIVQCGFDGRLAWRWFERRCRLSFSLHLSALCFLFIMIFLLMFPVHTIHSLPVTLMH